jgi:hypothetical protein
MSKDLYYTIPEYFIARMHEHSNVVDVVDMSNDNFFLYQIRRLRFEDSVLVWLSDAYRFTDMDFMNRPRELGSGDYVLVAKPEGGFSVSRALIDEAQIGVGKLAELMGALTKREIWTYVPPTWEERRLRKAQWEARPKG